jgi:hypothetical protein
LLIAEVPTLAGAAKAIDIVDVEGVMEEMVGIPGANKSEDVITRFVPSFDTATNSPAP